MSKRHNELTIGIMAIAVLAVVVFLVFTFGSKSFPTLSKGYKIYAEFEKASGVNRNTPVFKSGVKIGYVESVKLIDDAKRSYALVEIVIDSSRKVYSTEVCRINQSFMSSDATLDFVIDVNYDGPDSEVKSGETVRGVIPPDLVNAFGKIETKLTGTLDNISTAAEKMGVFIESVNAVIGSPEEASVKQERFQLLINDVQDTMKVINSLAKTVNDLVGDEEVNQSIREITNRLPATMNSVQKSLESIGTLTSEARTTMNRATGAFDKFQTNLDNIEDFTKSLGEEGPMIIRKVNMASGRLDGMLSDVVMLLDAFKNPDGSLGQLINNPELYEKIQLTVNNIEAMTHKLRPIADDLRVFSHKISSDPSVLGVRGAITPNVPLKGLPPRDTLKNSQPKISRAYDMFTDDTAGRISTADFTSINGMSINKNIMLGFVGGKDNDATLPRMASRQNAVQNAIATAARRGTGIEQFPIESEYEDETMDYYIGEPKLDFGYESWPSCQGGPVFMEEFSQPRVYAQQSWCQLGNMQIPSMLKSQWYGFMHRQYSKPTPWPTMGTRSWVNSSSPTLADQVKSIFCRAEENVYDYTDYGFDQGFEMTPQYDDGMCGVTPGQTPVLGFYAENADNDLHQRELKALSPENFSLEYFDREGIAGIPNTITPQIQRQIPQKPSGNIASVPKLGLGYNPKPYNEPQKPVPARSRVQYGSPVPQLAPQLKPSGTGPIPTTILNFDTDDAASEPLGHTFPSTNRGYIIELESDIPVVDKTKQVAQNKDPLSAYSPEISFTPPEETKLAAKETPKPKDPAQPKPAYKAPDKKYGSVKRGVN